MREYKVKFYTDEIYGDKFVFKWVPAKAAEIDDTVQAIIDNEPSYTGAAVVGVRGNCENCGRPINICRNSCLDEHLLPTNCQPDVHLDI